jgi:hypothetical protein
VGQIVRRGLSPARLPGDSADSLGEGWQGLGNSRSHLLPVERFEHCGVRTESASQAEAVVAWDVTATTGNRQDPGVGLNSPYCGNQLEAITVGHDDIRDQEIEALTLEHPRCILAALDARHRVTATAKPADQKIPDAFFVIGDQDGQRIGDGVVHTTKDGKELSGRPD